ncbi:lysis regulatory protein/holin [Bacteroides phage PhiCrAssBcn14]|nr:lysis regulatory protein/holin [Bacteroides phage PhiCrAssBcn14]WCF58509.1 lysis regulatory protein [Bacteroides phage PhiCrAssBcn15]WCF58751.1 lysis regulatory protein [Bacteroides phage PhiCrAssBcn18]WCI99878.1 lysis regulatory protein [Bacteroides phage PhiCrAssBcn16]
MKKYIIILILILIGAVAYLSYQNRQLTTKYETSIENVKAYDAQLSGLEGDNRVLKLTVEQLNYFNDSIIKKMKVVQKELGIKDKRLQQLQYEASHAQRHDTIVLRDTLFRDPQLKLDTIVGDKWFKTNLHLEFPSTIALSPEIELERYTFINGKRETVNPPKKFFLFRWFQKKMTVVTVTIKENNPYVKQRESRYIEIIK